MEQPAAGTKTSSGAKAHAPSGDGSSIVAALVRLATPHTSLGVSGPRRTVDAGEAANATRAHTRATAAETEPAGRNSELGSLVLISHDLVSLASKSRGAEDGRAQVSKSTTGGGSTSPASKIWTKTDIHPLDLCSQLPYRFVPTMPVNTVIDDAVSTARMFGLQRSIAVGCVMLASKILNRQFPEAARPVRQMFDLI